MGISASNLKAVQLTAEAMNVAGPLPSKCWDLQHQASIYSLALTDKEIRDWA